MDNRQLILVLVLSFSLVMIWDSWQKQNLPRKPDNMATAPATPLEGARNSAVPSPSAVPDPVSSSAVPGVSAPVPSKVDQKLAGQRVSAIVRTDAYVAEISSLGGDIVRLELVGHPDTDDKARNFTLFDNGLRHTYLAQSGIIGNGMPNHTVQWNLKAGEYRLGQGEKQLQVSLDAVGANGRKITKTYTFHTGERRYQIDVRHEGMNAGAPVYYKMTRDGKPAETAQSSLMMGVSTFTGPAVYTEADKYQKVEFSDIAKGKAKFRQKADDGWLAMVQHYFVTAWMPSDGAREFFMDKVGEDLFSAGVIVHADASGRSDMMLYAGPQEQDKLDKIAPGFGLVVDYGWLTVIAAPLFWVLAVIYKAVGNWGWAIIGLTVLLKLLFFPLSAASYKSMAKMRVLTPKLMRLKELYGEDKQRLNQEMMDLYRKEKVNPLGGCLPVLVQIPVFIALYWVLLGAVEMRNAPWLGWIVDLSVKDPYYVLPLLMGATMMIQTRLNPAPPDPIQAKVMTFMPIMFTFMFLWFPAGLVLYWTVNNLLSILQQWQITRTIESGKGG